MLPLQANIMSIPVFIPPLPKQQGKKDLKQLQLYLKKYLLRKNSMKKGTEILLPILKQAGFLKERKRQSGVAGIVVIFMKERKLLIYVRRALIQKRILNCLEKIINFIAV